MSVPSSHLSYIHDDSRTLVIERNWVEEMHEYATDPEFKGIETGGDMWGIWDDNGDCYVRTLTGPGEDATHGRESFHQDPAYMQTVAEAMHEAGNMHLVSTWVCEWCSHNSHVCVCVFLRERGIHITRSHWTYPVKATTIPPLHPSRITRGYKTISCASCVYTPTIPTRTVSSTDTA